MQTARNMQIMGNRLPTFGEAQLLAQTAPCEFVAEARALAAKHAPAFTTGRVERFSDDQKAIYQMPRMHRASRSW